MKKFRILILIIIALIAIYPIQSWSQLQADTSDAVWAIVMPVAASQDIDMKQWLVGSVKDSLVSGFVLNTGTWAFRVDTIYFRGADASTFALVSGFQKYVVTSGGSQSEEFRFKPLQARVYTAEIVIITQADTLIKIIRGDGIEPQLEIVADIIDFGIINVGNFKDSVQALTIKNIGSAPLTITNTRHNKPNDYDFKTLAGGGSFTLQPDETKKMDLQFKPSDVGRTSGVLAFFYNGVGSPAEVQLFGEGIKKNPKIIANAEPFQDLICENSISKSFTISNTGGNPLIISNLNINGSSEFSVTESLPITIEPDSTKNFSITFKPQSTGIKTAYLEILSNADPDSILIIPISARKDSVSFSTNVTKVDFGNLKLNETSNKNLIIMNTGTLSCTYNLSVSGNIQINPNKITLLPQAEATINVFYPGNNSLLTIKEQITISDTICGNIKLIEVEGQVFSSTVQLKTIQLEAYPGDVIEVPIILNNDLNLQLSGATSFKTDLSYNSTLLWSLDYPKQTVNDTTAKITIDSLPVNKTIGDTLTKVRFKVGLGNAEKCGLVLTDAKAIGGTVDISVLNGHFKLLGVCQEGGKRLINPNGNAIDLKISPNPSDGNIIAAFNLIEDNNTTLRIYDNTGNVVYEKNIEKYTGKMEMNIDTSTLGSGLYFVSLQTPTVRIVKPLMIAK